MISEGNTRNGILFKRNGGLVLKAYIDVDHADLGCVRSSCNVTVATAVIVF